MNSELESPNKSDKLSNFKLAKSKSSWCLSKNIREKIHEKMQLEKERSKASDLSYSNFIYENCSQNKLISFVRDMQKKIANGGALDSPDAKEIKSKHIENCIINMRDKFTLGNDKESSPGRRFALINDNYKFSFKKRSLNGISVKQLSTRCMKMNNFKVVGKDMVEVVDSNIEIPKSFTLNNEIKKCSQILKSKRMR